MSEVDQGSFKAIADANEHTFARFLRKQKAIDNWCSFGDSGNQWHSPDGKIVAMCMYDNVTSDCTYYIRSDLSWES